MRENSVLSFSDQNLPIVYLQFVFVWGLAMLRWSSAKNIMKNMESRDAHIPLHGNESFFNDSYMQHQGPTSFTLKAFN